MNETRLNSRPLKFWKTTLVVITDYDPSKTSSTELAREVSNGTAFVTPGKEVFELRSPSLIAEAGRFFYGDNY